MGMNEPALRQCSALDLAGLIFADPGATYRERLLAELIREADTFTPSADFLRLPLTEEAPNA